MEDTDSRRTARYFIRKYGASAPFVARERKLAMAIHNDKAGVTMWSRIEAYIRDLQGERVEGAEQNGDTPA